jgi:hypothetical protein
MSKNNVAIQQIADRVKELMPSPSSSDAEVSALYRAAKIELIASQFDYLFANREAGYPPIESILELRRDQQESALSEALQEMVGKGYDYTGAAVKMIETAFFILQVNKLIHRRDVWRPSAGLIETTIVDGLSFASAPNPMRKVERLRGRTLNAEQHRKAQRA